MAIIETRISQHSFAAMDEEVEQRLKDVSKKFARDMRFDFTWDYYSIYWTEENWLLACLAEPEITALLKKV